MGQVPNQERGGDDGWTDADTRPATERSRTAWQPARVAWSFSLKREETARQGVHLSVLDFA